MQVGFHTAAESLVEEKNLLMEQDLEVSKVN